MGGGDAIKKGSKKNSLKNIFFMNGYGLTIRPIQSKYGLNAYLFFAKYSGSPNQTVIFTLTAINIFLMEIFTKIWSK